MTKKLYHLKSKTMEQFFKISITDNNYPKLLREISHAPEFFYVWGRRENFYLLDSPSIAVVGTRRCSEYGRETARYFASSLSQSGLTIVSGLANGIDEEAHKAVLKTGGKTIAVIGSGMDKESLYPSNNYALAREIAESDGLVISEHKAGVPALPQHFPQRNRIVSGLCLGVIVVEAKEKSGALITADFALQQNREVFAVPGPIFNLNSAGPNLLIQKGAKLVLKPEDVLEELTNISLAFNIPENRRNEKEHLLDSEEERKIMEILRQECLNIDEITQKLNLPITTISPVLSVLEIKGIVAKRDEKYVIIQQ